MTADVSLLDNPAWHSLTGAHAKFAQVHGAARRYDPEVSFLSAIAHPADAGDPGWADLAGPPRPGAAHTLAAPGTGPPAGWEIVHEGQSAQMIDVSVDAVPDEEALVLGPADAEEMYALAHRAQPGPWFARTYELGTYLGIRRDGELVAMAGERQHPAGWTEVSAVATDERFRGHGFAGRLVRAVSFNIRQRGERPLLHARHDNDNAIRLYEHLGFAHQPPTRFVTLRTPS